MTTEAFREYASEFSVPATGNADQRGTPYQMLRRLADVDTLRRKGTFFTADQLAGALWEPIYPELNGDSIVLDPASGAGDLVIPVARWASQTQTRLRILLNDVEDIFLPIACSRLRSANESIDVTTYSSDFLSQLDVAPGVTHLAINPPYFAMNVERDWARGKVSAAAVFVEHALLQMRPGATLLAVLPDVLRSGSRYAKWRALVESAGTVARVAPQGQFDAYTDVHVFLLTVRVGGTGAHASWVSDAKSGDRLGDHCEVRVGPVVPHRDSEEGPNVPFVSARNLTSGTQERRRFRGRLEKGPMVLVNRTSRPGDRPRIRARVRFDDAPVAVENHLLVLKPLDGSRRSCERIVELLGRESTWEYLDERIRCRHLTVSAIKEIPWQT